jgi:hypothetical protein
MANWQIQGRYMETCNCEYLCPCIDSNLTATPTEGDCKAALALQIETGEKDGVNLDGLSFVVLMHAPKAMIEGDITVGLIVDEHASDEQAQAIAAIASGEVGGPMAALAPLVTKIAGIEKRPIRFEGNGMKYSVTAGELLDEACEGFASAANPDEPMHIDNTMHPVNPKLALARASHSHMHAFGIDWDDSSGTRNGHFAPFSWAG